MDWITTSTILAELADFSNQSAWKRFSDRFRLPIVRFARRMGLSESDADDVAQETLTAFAAAYREGKYDRSKGRLSAWLFGIAYRQALNARRGDARRGTVLFQPEHASFWDAVPDDHAARDQWECEWESALLELCLHRVRQEVEPMTMRLFEAVMGQDRTPEQVARDLGVAVKAVYNAKYTVLKRMRELRGDFEDQL